MSKRKHIPSELEIQILVNSARRCCLCFGLNNDLSEKRGQIAHLDRDPSNSSLDNLAFLCFAHHDQYDSKTSQSKSLQIEEVKHYRSELYKAVDRLRTSTSEPEDDPPKQPGGQGMDALWDSKIEYRRDRVRRWREAVEAFDFRNESFGSTVWYSELRLHLQEGIVKKIDAPRTYIVPAEKRGESAEKYILLDEIARIEGEWDLI